jgi:hypothetical protein
MVLLSSGRGIDEIRKFGLGAYLVGRFHGQCLLSDSFLLEFSRRSCFLGRFVSA